MLLAALERIARARLCHLSCNKMAKPQTLLLLKREVKSLEVAADRGIFLLRDEQLDGRRRVAEEKAFVRWVRVARI